MSQADRQPTRETRRPTVTSNFEIYRTNGRAKMKYVCYFQLSRCIQLLVNLLDSCVSESIQILSLQRCRPCLFAPPDLELFKKAKRCHQALYHGRRLMFSCSLLHQMNVAMKHTNEWRYLRAYVVNQKLVACLTPFLIPLVALVIADKTHFPLDDTIPQLTRSHNSFQSPEIVLFFLCVACAHSLSSRISLMHVEWISQNMHQES